MGKHISRRALGRMRGDGSLNRLSGSFLQAPSFAFFSDASSPLSLGSRLPPPNRGAIGSKLHESRLQDASATTTRL